MMGKEQNLSRAAGKSGMDRKTARRYLKLSIESEPLPTVRKWRTRPDPFFDVWPEMAAFLEENPGLEALALFEHLQALHPGRFSDGQLRTFQRRVKQWRATQGPGKEVMFPQDYKPGERSQSDFTCLNGLGVTIEGQPFDHLLYHFVLCHSGWETGMVCYSESQESLLEGLERALWELGGVPMMHQSDNLAAAVNPKTREFTERYKGFLKHYGIEGGLTNPHSPHENGKVEQGHHRVKRRLEQALLLRGSRDFMDRADYDRFIREQLDRWNANRTGKVKDDVSRLGSLPSGKWNRPRKLRVKVRCYSTVTVDGNTYSVPSRLIGEWVDVSVSMDHIDIYHGQVHMDRLPRLRGKSRHHIRYQHVIDSLVKKPGAFAGYRFREDMFPTLTFRMAYDRLRESRPEKADKEYLMILRLASRHGETSCKAVLKRILEAGTALSSGKVETHLLRKPPSQKPDDPRVEQTDLSHYDCLIVGGHHE